MKKAKRFLNKIRDYFRSLKVKIKEESSHKPMLPSTQRGGIVGLREVVSFGSHGAVMHSDEAKMQIAKDKLIPEILKHIEVKPTGWDGDNNVVEVTATINIIKR